MDFINSVFVLLEFENLKVCKFVVYEYLQNYFSYAIIGIAK
jgi:hypothetical protein